MRDSTTRNALIWLLEAFASVIMMTLLSVAAIVLICFTPFAWAFQRWFRTVQDDVESKGPRI